MRTTIDIDDDVLGAAKERARRENRTAGQVISDLVRRALATPAPSAHTSRSKKAHFGVRPFAKRGTTVTNEVIDSLREDDACAATRRAK